MSKPIFGSLPLQKYQTRTFDVPLTIHAEQYGGPRSPKVAPSHGSPQRFYTSENPLMTNVFLPKDSASNVDNIVDYKRALILAQRELMNTHEEILRLEAELRAARYK